MKNLDLNSMGVRELDAREMQETDGGIIIALIIAGAALLLSSCGNNLNLQIGKTNTIINTQSVDSSFNGNVADSVSFSGSLNPNFTPIQK